MNTLKYIWEVITFIVKAYWESVRNFEGVAWVIVLFFVVGILYSIIKSF